MGRYRKCAVLGCENKDATRHRFPNPCKFMDLFNIWVQACGNDSLTSLDPDLIYRSHRVCHIHFKDVDKSTNMYLKKTAVPTEFLKHDFHHKYFISETPSPKRQKCMDSELSRTLDEPQPSTSKQPCTLSTPMQLSLLQEVGGTSYASLTPQCQVLYKRAKYYKRSAAAMRKKKNSFKQRLHILQHVSKEEAVNQVTSSLSSNIANFIKSQILLQPKKPKGRRYTLNDKIMGLILYKQSGRGYRLLSEIFALPSRQTMMSLLRKIPIKAGINESIFASLKANVEQLNETDRHCVLMFDEMSIQPHLQFNKHGNDVEGFVDLGDEQSNLIADHVQVFMAKGIANKWKQPLCYMFTHSTMKTIDLVRILKNVIRRCHTAGLTVVATVCDQGSTNVAAINYLLQSSAEEDIRTGKDSDKRFYRVEGYNIIHIYDPPHLLKGIRNNLLNKNLIWTQSVKNEIIGKWSEIECAYNIDNASGDLRCMPKLTDGHVLKDKIKKMKVANAAQVFSYTVASVIALFARSGTTAADGSHLQARAKETATILNFWDKVFDSVNGTSLYPRHGKNLRCAVSSISDHMEFWKEAKSSIRNMYFKKECSREKVMPPSLKNWIVSITGFEEVYKLLCLKNITFFAPRVFNQDPLENFFGQIRQHGSRNTNPTTTMFKCHFKTLLINNFVGKHSVGSNCEMEESRNIVSVIKEFVTQDVPTDGRIISNTADLNFEQDITHKTFVDKASIGYVSGFIARNLRHFYKTCPSCKNNLLCKDGEINEWHSLIDEKEFCKNVPRKLKYCTPELVKGIALCYDIIKKIFPTICHEKSSFLILKDVINKNVFFNFKNHCEHNEELSAALLAKFAALCCYNWCNGINRLLHGRDSRIKKYDCIYKQASEMFRKQRKYRY